MDIIKFETRAKGVWVEFTHGEVTSSTADDALPGDHVLRVHVAGTMAQVVLTPEQWGKLVDTLSATIVRRVN